MVSRSALAALTLTTTRTSRRLDRKVGGLFAFEDAVDVGGGASVHVGTSPV